MLMNNFYTNCFIIKYFNVVNFKRETEQFMVCILGLSKFVYYLSPDVKEIEFDRNIGKQGTCSLT